VDIQFKALEQHVEHSIKLMTAQVEKQKAELDGKIDLLHKDINDLQGKRHDKNQRRWDTRVLVLSIIVTAIVTFILGMLAANWSTLWAWLTRP
jgi:type II secretory pathway component PulL